MSDENKTVNDPREILRLAADRLDAHPEQYIAPEEDDTSIGAKDAVGTQVHPNSAHAAVWDLPGLLCSVSYGNEPESQAIYEVTALLFGEHSFEYSLALVAEHVFAGTAEELDTEEGAQEAFNQLWEVLRGPVRGVSFILRDTANAPAKSADPA